MEKTFDFKKLCEDRYSCRLYADKPVENDKLEYIIECARLAPSAVNRQPWRLRVITEPAELVKVREAYNREWFRTAPVVLAVSALKDEAWKRQSDGKCHADIDAAIFTEHICLAATAVGLGSCWVCNFDPEISHRNLNIDDNEELVALIPIGYPNDMPKAKSRKSVTDLLA